MTKHIKTRRKLQSIADLKSFNEILDNSTLSSEDKYIVREHYLNDKNFAYIADELGYAEITVVKKHQKILKKIGKMLK